VTLLSVNASARLQSLMNGKVAAGIRRRLTYLAQDRGFHVLAGAKTICGIFRPAMSQQTLA
jgi:hypothetical protein